MIYSSDTVFSYAGIYWWLFALFLSFQILEHCEKPFTHFCVDFYISLLLGMSRNGICRAYDNSEIAKLLYFSVYIPTNNVHFSVFPTHVPSIDSSLTVATLVWSGASLLWWLMTLRSFLNVFIVHLHILKKCLNYLKKYFSFSHVSFYMHVLSPWSLEKNTGYPGAGVTGSTELHGVGTGKCWKRIPALNTLSHLSSSIPFSFVLLK